MKLAILSLVLIFTIFPLAINTYATGHNQTGIGIDPGRILPGMGLPDQGLGSGPGTLTTIIRNLVVLFYSVGALGFTIMIIWGAVSWILSGGDKEAVAGARKRITTALVGLFLLALSFPIINIIAQISGINILGDLPLKNLTAP